MISWSGPPTAPFFGSANGDGSSTLRRASSTHIMPRRGSHVIGPTPTVEANARRASSASVVMSQTSANRRPTRASDAMTHHQQYQQQQYQQQQRSESFLTIPPSARTSFTAPGAPGKSMLAIMARRISLTGGGSVDAPPPAASTGLSFSTNPPRRQSSPSLRTGVSGQYDRGNVTSQSGGIAVPPSTTRRGPSPSSPKRRASSPSRRRSDVRTSVTTTGTGQTPAGALSEISASEAEDSDDGNNTDRESNRLAELLNRAAGPVLPKRLPQRAKSLNELQLMSHANTFISSIWALTSSEKEKPGSENDGKDDAGRGADGGEAAVSGGGSSGDGKKAAMGSSSGGTLPRSLSAEDMFRMFGEPMDAPPRPSGHADGRSGGGSGSAGGTVGSGGAATKVKTPGSPTPTVQKDSSLKNTDPQDSALLHEAQLAFLSDSDDDNSTAAAGGGAGKSRTKGGDDGNKTRGKEKDDKPKSPRAVPARPVSTEKTSPRASTRQSTPRTPEAVSFGDRLLAVSSDSEPDEGKASSGIRRQNRPRMSTLTEGTGAVQHTPSPLSISRAPFPSPPSVPVPSPPSMTMPAVLRPRFGVRGRHSDILLPPAPALYASSASALASLTSTRAKSVVHGRSGSPNLARGASATTNANTSPPSHHPLSSHLPIGTRPMSSALPSSATYLQRRRQSSSLRHSRPRVTVSALTEEEQDMLACIRPIPRSSFPEAILRLRKERGQFLIRHDPVHRAAAAMLLRKIYKYITGPGHIIVIDGFNKPCFDHPEEEEEGEGEGGTKGVYSRYRNRQTSSPTFESSSTQLYETDFHDPELDDNDDGEDDYLLRENSAGRLIQVPAPSATIPVWTYPILCITAYALLLPL